jgi:hypothetical protein
MPDVRGAVGIGEGFAANSAAVEGTAGVMRKEIAAITIALAECKARIRLMELAEVCGNDAGFLLLIHAHDYIRDREAYARVGSDL